MSLGVNDQKKLAKTILQIIDKNKKDVITLEKIHELTVDIVNMSGFKSNGIAFSLQEYTYETLEIARGKNDTGWKDEAYKKLIEQIGE